MTYCIVKIIYGTPLNDKAQNEFEKLGIDTEEIFEGKFGCTLLYSGNAETDPAFCGVELDEFDEATDMALDVSKLKMTPSANQIKIAREKISKLPPSVQKLLQPLGIYFIFHSS